MAEEKITVIEGNFSTASFDVSARVLRIPVFKEDVSDSISTLMITHEIGHALFTPEDGWHESARQFPGLSRSLINIVEDVRIERLIKLKYPGALYFFMKGYNELLGLDFFGIKDVPDLNELGFLNRVNMSAKCGELLDIDFTIPEEAQLFEECFLTETFDDVILLCQKIAEYLKEKKLEEEEPEPEEEEEQQEPEEEENDEPQGGDAGEDESEADDGGEGPQGDDGQGGESGESGEDSDGEGAGQSETGQPTSASEDGGDGSSSGQQVSDGDDEGEQPASGMASSGDDSDRADDDASNEKPAKKRDTSNVELDFESEQSEDDSCSTDISQRNKETELIYDKNDVTLIKFPMWMNVTEKNQINSDLKGIYDELVKDTKPSVELLTSQFNRRKAAHAKALSKKKTSGHLDGKRLHSYKTSANLFQKKVIRPRQKNHGVVMLLDNSSSMWSDGKILMCLQQILIMTEFCLKNAIPFEILQFGHGSGQWDTSEDGSLTSLPRCSVLLSSTWAKSEYRRNAGRLYDAVKNSKPRRVSRGCTPLESHLLSAANRCLQFKRDTGVEKLHFMCLTDGAADYATNVNRVIFGSEGLKPIHFNNAGLQSSQGNMIYFTYRFLRAAVCDSITLFSLDTQASTTVFGVTNYGQPDPTGNKVKVYENLHEIDKVIEIPCDAIRPMLKGNTPEAKKNQKFICLSLIDNLI